MTYNEKKELDKIEVEAQRKREELQGITPRVKALKEKVERVSASANGSYDHTKGHYTYPWETEESRRADRLEEIRQGLMADPKLFFGDTDHAIVRDSLQLESLNLRQRKHLDKAYPWMAKEAQENIKELPEEEWFYPLLEELETLTEKEAGNITLDERMHIVSFKQRKGHNWLNTPTIEEKYDI